MEYKHRFYLAFRLSIFILFACCGYDASAQSVVRQSISSIGSSSSIDGITIQSSVGQASSTVMTSSGKSVLRQGFIQPPSSGAVINENLIPALVFPNPSTGLFYIQMEFRSGDYYEVMNLAGQKIYTQSINGISSMESFDISNQSEGLYILSIFRNNTKVQSQKLALTQ